MVAYDNRRPDRSYIIGDKPFMPENDVPDQRKETLVEFMVQPLKGNLSIF
jgi:hypothetical protein